MQVQRHYLKAPITEAIIDLKVAFKQEFSVDRLAEIHDRIKDRFPTQQPIYTGVGAFTIDPGVSINVNTTQQHNGFLFRSIDNLRIFQATLGGFTFNRLSPYESWEEFSSDAKYLWDIYKEIYKPEHITRAAIRYINQINIPTQGLVNIQDYLRTIPEVPDNFPQKTLQSFFMQLQIPQEDLDCMLVLNETLAPQITPEFITVVLDFDLFRQQIWRSDDEEIWMFLEQLRHRKNEIFETSITEKTKEMFD